MSLLAILTYTYTSSTICVFFKENMLNFHHIFKLLGNIASWYRLLSPKIEFLTQFWISNVSLQSLFPLRNYLRSMVKKCIQNWVLSCFESVKLQYQLSRSGQMVCLGAIDARVEVFRHLCST